MFDGKYKSSLNTPMGAINGTITLISNGNNVQGIIETMGMKNNFIGVKTKENEASFSGNFNTPLGNIQYKATCVVMNNNLELIASTNKGNFKLVGQRI